MSQTLNLFLKIVVLAGLGAMFYVKIVTNTLGFYINQRFAWLSYVAVLILLSLALTMIYRLVERRSAQRAASFDERHDDVPIELRRKNTSKHSHSHSHSHELTWLGIAIISLPMLVGLLVPARPLSSGAIASRGIGLTAPNRPGSVAQIQRSASGPKNIIDWLREFSRDADLSNVVGKEADVIGFVYRDPRSKSNEFWVSRFAISCCVADASAIGLLVQTDEAASLKNDSWVHVKGKFAMGEFAGEKVPIIIGEKVEPTQQPTQPYLYF